MVHARLRPALQGRRSVERCVVLKSRALRWLSWTVLAVLLLWGAAWLAVPPLLKWQLETRGSQLLGRELRVGEVQFAPTTLSPIIA